MSEYAVVPLWHILKREVWTQGVDVRAATLAEAVQLVLDGEGNESQEGLEYSDTLDADTWSAWDENCDHYWGPAALQKEIDCE